MKFRHRQSGFSLLEIMVAVTILAVSMLVILDLHGGTMITSRRAEDVTVGTMLARLKLHELQLEIESDIGKGMFPSEDKHIEGSFEEPYERYRWEADIKKVELPIPGGPDEEGGAGKDVMFQMFKIVADQLAESAREISLSVKWDDLGEEQSISVATHIVKL